MPSARRRAQPVGAAYVVLIARRGKPINSEVGTDEVVQKQNHGPPVTSSGNVRRLIYTVSQKKRHPFYFCDIFAKRHPILLIFGTNVPQEI